MSDEPEKGKAVKQALRWVNEQWQFGLTKTQIAAIATAVCAVAALAGAFLL